MLGTAIANAPEHMESAVNEIPLSRLGQADENATAGCGLCSPGAGFTVGHALVVDGGYTVR
jgi:hypothetical protein